MSYEEALRRAERVGVSKAEKLEFLALVCKSLASIHAINPAMVFAGAQKLGLDAKQVVKLAEADPVALGDLMFV